MPTPEENLEQAKKDAEVARKKADELVLSRDEAQKKRHKALELWRVRNDALDKVKKEAEDLEAQAKAFEEAAEDPQEDDLEEEETVEAAKVRLAAAAVEARKKRDGFGLEGRQKGVDLVREDYRKARALHRDARDKAKVALDDAEAADNIVSDCEQAIYHTELFIGWDGIHSADGRNNRAYGESVTSKRAAARRTAKTEDVKSSVAARLTREENEELSARLDKKNIWVRIPSCDSEVAPIANRVVAKLDVGRVFLVESMMIRVYDDSDDDDAPAIYQEILNAGEIDRLPRTRTLAARHQETIEQRVDRCDEHARKRRQPYRFVVWVSKKPGAFDGIALDKDPEEKRAVQVNDQSPRSDGDTATSGAGVNQFDVHRMYLVTLAVMNELTNHGKDRDARTLPQKIDEIRAGIKAANTKFGRKRVREIRLFLGPEWNFQPKAYPWTHTPDEKDAIVDALKALSAEDDCKQWLVLPGTILWGKSHDNGVLAVLNTLVCLYQGAVVHTYNKKQWGSDTYLNEFVYDECLLETEADGWERRHNKLNSRQVPKSFHTKMGAKQWSLKGGTVEVDVLVRDQRWRIKHQIKDSANRPTYIVKKPGHKKLDIIPGELFAMTLPGDVWDTFFPGSSRDDYDKPNCFEHKGLKLGIDICADHKGVQCGVSYKANGEPGKGAGKDNGVDLYIFTSCNVDRELWKAPARTGGYFFHCDGGSFGVTGYAVTGREFSAGDIGQLFIDARAKRDPAKRGTDYESPKNPGAALDKPTVAGDRLTSETIAAGGASFELYRIVIVDP